jgi:5-methylcytosine-specific restriction endonuclease McrA
MEKPKHSCARPGCPILTNKRYCDQHANLGKRAHRERHSAVYDSPGWKQYSRDFLAKHPVCADPFGLHRGVPVRATCTGHKVAHRGDMRLFSDPANHYPLCNSCNASQACRTEGGFGNPMRKKSE